MRNLEPPSPRIRKSITARTKDQKASTRLKRKSLARSKSGWVVAVLTVALCLLALTAAIGPRPTSAATSVFINEIHYDNTGTDAGEAIEVAGPAGTNLTGWSIVLYNGTGGAVYDTDALSGVIPNQQNGFGTISLSYPSNGIQNGSPDGIALVNGTTVVQFLSYEGSFTGVGGPANGMLSTDIGVSEAGTEPVGQSLRLSGTGCNYEDFTWNSPATASFGAVNTGQTFSCGGGPALSINDVSMAEGDSGTTLFTFTVSLSSPAGAGGVTFDIATADGTAQDDNPPAEDNDYVASSLTGQTILSGNSSYMFSVTVNGDMITEPNETFFVNVTNITGATPSDTQGQGTISNDDVTLTPIHTIQGSGSASPLAGASVTTRGIVTGIKLGSSGGFFIQEPDATVDADPSTSEGVFVFTGASVPAAAVVGNFVQVTGTVQEFVFSSDPNSPPITEISGSPAAVQLSTGNPLPVPITLTVANTTAPSGTTNPLDTLEEFEGMRVTVASMTVIAPTDGTINEPNATVSGNDVFYGVVTGVTRPFREPGVNISDPLPPGSPASVPRFDENPERIRVDSDGQPGTTAVNVAAGTVINNVTGPLDYSFRTYTILPDATLMPGTQPGATPVPTPAANELTVASFNMERFFDTVNDPSTSDPVLTAAAFDKRLDKASRIIRTVQLLPDVIGVEEMENLSTLQAVATKINNDVVGGGGSNPGYVAYLVEGNDVGGIDNGFLVKESRVTTVSVTQYNKTETYVNPNTGGMETLNDRPPLVLRATVGSFAFTVIVNHLRSLSGVDDDVTPNGTGTEGTRVRAKRKAQAESLANLIQSFQTADPMERIITVGDMNAFQFNDGFVDVIGTVKGTPSPDDQTVVPGDGADLVNPDQTNLVDMLMPDQRYSFTFDGNAQVLDQIILNPNAFAQLSRFAYARDDADFPVKNYELANELRLSDHDQPVAYFTIPPPCMITCPDPITRSNDANQCGAVVTFAPMTTGTCGTINCSPASGSNFPVGTTTVNCSSSAGPSCSFTVTVNDTQAPNITCPNSLIRPTDPNQCSAVVTYDPPVVSDNCESPKAPKGPAPLTPVCNPASGSTFPKGVTTVTCTVSDSSKNQASCSFTITVNDTQAPTITCPMSFSRPTDPNLCTAVVTFPPPTVGDNCSNGTSAPKGVPALTPVCVPASGSIFPKGITTVTCTVSDASGNQGSCSFTVTVNDTQSPVFPNGCNANIYTAAAVTCPISSSRVVNYTNPMATDNCPGVTVMCSPPSGSNFPVGITTVTCTASDTSGNMATCSFQVTVFSLCLVDETNSGNVVLFNVLTGDYRFCCNGLLVATGRGTLTVRGCIVNIDESKGDRKVRITADTSVAGGAGMGTAVFQKSGSAFCQITDKSMAGNACNCN